ncbi:IS3 family transposase [Schinkia azotoformans]|uniref:IS3 family transposase n=1 Tax=Schinkia azotoformans TaxID=1454 RepID=UPI002DBE5EC3|nr:IS3 family transposase [Schinkia azotoformans]MEC1718662.1 IS3 family transposase [Schinkia azotoformans]MEC1743780.1 IS3 family transposase [Schinkia azotoformans]MEC1746512.1 IS3 family transposase [Schinkia azotoformans]MEC1769466.1 IS3 family transposase [Schinkia azotoformans]MEC1789661.1 IS3 family transposase [Schinkia azotoformans]
MEDKYVAIQELHEKEELSILLLCEIAGISRAAYYKWLRRKPTSRDLLNEEIIKEMKALHEKVEGIFGYRQMALHMNRKFKMPLNYKRIYRLMKVPIYAQSFESRKNNINVLFPNILWKMF